MPDKQTDKVPQLKANAVIKISMGTAFIGKLQEVLQHHIIDHEDDIKALQAKNKEGKYEDLTPWENCAVTLTTLMQVIMKEAEATEQLEYVDLKDLIPSGLQADSDQH